jgi:hypothetical protein
MKKRLIAVLLGFVVMLWGVWELPLASYSGGLAAMLDISRGRLTILGYGFPSMSRPQYQALLQKKYGIEYKAVARCVVSQTERNYVDGYDRVSMAAAKRRFGPEIFAESAKEAEAETRVMHPEYYRASAK